MKKLLLIILLSTLVILVVAYRQPTSNPQMVDDIYKGQLENFDKALANLRECIKNNDNNNAVARTGFLQVRLAYKKLSVITDYLNPYETILLNAPALARTEDDNPTNIIPPHGLQQLEALLWQDTSFDKLRPDIMSEIDFVQHVIQDLKQEPGRIQKFGNEKLWQSLRVALITLQTKTITAFDSPLSLNAMAESKATLQSMQQYLAVYRDDIEKNQPGVFDQINHLITAAIASVDSATSFNQFNRLAFLKEKAIPLSNAISNASTALHLQQNTERMPVNAGAANLFTPNFFDINFFSPNKRYAFTKERMLLGKALFYDTRLSANGSRSCAGCHKPELAFTDGLKQALNIDGKSFLQRNTPTLLNAVYQTKQFYDSRQTMLEFQVSNVVHNDKEMGGSIESLVLQLEKDEAMASQFAIAYPNDKAPVNRYTVANAIANYMRSLQSMNAKFDKYMRNETDVQLSPAEQNGFNLFMGKAKCGTCHFMPLFNGLVPPNFSETESEVLGVPASLQKPYVLDADSGRYYFTTATVHLFAFKIPTLRNIALTAPYMHNGVYKTLNQVIDFYNNGGGAGLGIAPVNQTLPPDKLQLTKNEKKDLVAFLLTLTDTVSYKQF